MQAMQTISHRLSNLLGAIAAWLCLAPVVIARDPLSIPSTLAPASTHVHSIANLSVFVIWTTGGIFLARGRVPAFGPFIFRAYKSDPLSGPAQIYRSTEIDLASTLIPRVVLVLFSHGAARDGPAVDSIARALRWRA